MSKLELNKQISNLTPRDFLNTTEAKDGIGQLLRAARKTSGLSQIEVVSELRITQGYLSKIERGLLDPSAILVIDFAQLLNIDLNSFRKGYIDRGTSIKLMDLKKIGGFKIPSKYGKSASVRIPFANGLLALFCEKYGKKKLHDYLNSCKIDPDYFLVFDNQINYNFILDLLDTFLTDHTLMTHNYSSAYRHFRRPEFHGALADSYSKQLTPTELLVSFIQNQDKYALDFTYSLQDRKNGELEIKVTTQSHIKSFLKKRGQNIRNYFKFHHQGYFNEFLKLNGINHGKVQYIEKFDIGMSSCHLRAMNL